MNIMPLSLYGVIEPGVPNQERVALQITEAVELSEFGLLVGTSTHDLKALPFNDMFFLLGSEVVAAGDWVFIYTGHGTKSVTNLPNGNRLVSLYWKRPNTVFFRPGIVPIVFRVAAFTTLPPPPEPQPLPQYGPGAINKLAELLTRGPESDLFTPTKKP